MKKIAVFGATGGVGVKLIPFLQKKYEIIALSSKLVNVTSFNEVQNFFENNDIDIVLNMSGKSYDVYLSKITENNYQEMIEMIDVNIIGNINILAACLPKMIKKKWGRIIAISSIFAELNIPKASIYCASKAFLDRLISVVNKENIRFGITCNTIQLGYWGDGMCDRADEKIKNTVKETIGLKRWGKPEELYNTIDYIIENEYLCGINLKIAGGL